MAEAVGIPNSPRLSKFLIFLFRLSLAFVLVQGAKENEKRN